MRVALLDGGVISIARSAVGRRSAGRSLAPPARALLVRESARHAVALLLDRVSTFEGLWLLLEHVALPAHRGDRRHRSVRARRRVALISENWFFPDDGSYPGLWSFGLRFLGERIAVDLALVNSFEDPSTPGVPWLGFAFRF